MTLLNNTPFCYVLLDSKGKLRSPHRFPQPTLREQQPNEQIVELYAKAEPTEDALLEDLKSYIESQEVTEGFTLERLIAERYMPPVYYRLVQRIKELK